MGDLDRARMVEILLEAFPAIEPDLLSDSWSELLHPQMGCFAKYAQRQIDEGERAAVQRCFELADRFFRDGTSDVRNAVVVSFLEHLNFTDGKRARSWASPLLPPRLHNEYLSIEAG